MRICLFLMFLTVLVAPSAWSTPVGDPWNCQMVADLVGNADFYLLYGRDSWQGKSNLKCESNRGQFTQDMEISFNSLVSGVGVNEDSKIHVVLQMRTTVRPAANQSIYVHVSNSAQGLAVRWHIESELSQIDIDVTGDGKSNIHQSLYQGSLYIR